MILVLILDWREGLHTSNGVVSAAAFTCLSLRSTTRVLLLGSRLLAPKQPDGPHTVQLKKHERYFNFFSAKKSMRKLSFSKLLGADPHSWIPGIL